MLRRKLLLEDLEAVIAECEGLLGSGYTQNGKWSLGQICHHIRLTIDASVNGFPIWMILVGYPLRPFLRRWLLPRLLRGDSPSGIRTARRYEPPLDLDDAREVEALRQSISRFHESTQTPRAHPGFGTMPKGAFERFHAAHASHHLSFLGVLNHM